MAYEISVIEKWAQQAPDNELAFDLGCGTGRDSFVLARRFDQVYAYDFSPNMIAVAGRNKLARAAGNVLFQVRDIEKGLADIEAGSASFVNSAFGMGSFVENPESFFREIRRILKPQGIAIFSYYNAKALVNQLNLQWRPALAARASAESDVLRVDFAGEVYDIAAKAYTLPEIRKKMEGNFDLAEISTFPTLSALFPQELFEDESARRLCTEVDRLLAENGEIAAGPYIVAVGRRPGKMRKPAAIEGYAKVLALLSRHNVPPQIIHHAPVRSMDEVRSVLDADPDQMVKSIVVAVSEPGSVQRHPRLYLFGIAADRKLDFAKVAAYLGKARRAVRAATQSEVEELTGFTVGSVPPFGLPARVVTILDEPLVGKDFVWCGTGKATESLRLRMDDLRRLSAFSVADVSKAIPMG